MVKLKMNTEWWFGSLLLFASLFTLLLFLAASSEAMHFMDLFNVFIIFFFCSFERWWKNVENLSMLLLMRPVCCIVAEFISCVKIHIFCFKELNDLSVTLTSSDMHTSKSELILYFWISSTVHELIKSFKHVLLCSNMHRCIASNVFVILNVWLGTVL